MAQFLCLKFSLIPSSSPLTRENDTKKLIDFAKVQFLNDKIDQNTNFAKMPSAKCLLLSILLLKNQSFAKLFRYFCVRSSGE
jgi:hypothetical protein